MYTLKTGFAKPFIGNGEWVEVDFTTLSFATIYATYRQAIVVLTNPFEARPVAFDVEKLRFSYAASSKTIVDFLADNGSNALDTTYHIPYINKRYAIYNDAFVAGFQINAVNPSTSPDAELTTGAKDWLHLSYTGMDYAKFKKNCLVTVNGYLHFTETDTNGIWVDNGMQSVEHANQNTVGIISFEGISTFTAKRITDSMIHNQGGDNQLGIRSYIETGVDLTNKTIAISLGGYLHVLDETTFYRVSDSRICVDFNNLPFFERFYESSKNIDFSSLNLIKSDVNASVVAVSDILSDSVIRRFLKLPQSFLVIFDNAELMVQKVPLEDGGLPNVYQTETLPQYPVFGGFGRMMNYLAEQCGGVWNILMIDTFKKRFMLNKTLDPLKAVNLSDSRVTEKMSERDKFWFLLIGTNIDYTA